MYVPALETSNSTRGIPALLLFFQGFPEQGTNHRDMPATASSLCEGFCKIKIFKICCPPSHRSFRDTRDLHKGRIRKLLLWGKVLARPCQPPLLSAYRKEQNNYCLYLQPPTRLPLIRNSISETAHL